MKAILTIASCALWNHAALAQFPLPDSTSVRSLSGQFVVYSSQLPSAATAPAALLTNANYLELESSLVAVSCERIKQALWAELDIRGQWSGKIHLSLRAARSEDDPVTIISDRFPKGWSYRLELPQFVERRRYVCAIVQTLLQERANRQAGARAAEIPFWLTEGLTRHLQDTRAGELILPSPRWNWRGLELSPVINEERRRDPLASARQRLRQHAPLSLEELSWPTAELVSGEAGEIFGCSAQLFVTELLRLKGGRDCLRAMLDDLAGCYNWQTAFFRAFPQHFTRQLDLEKWWDLQLVHFTGRDPSQLWTVEDSWRKLEQILRAPVEVRGATNELPAHTDVSLQAVVREWDALRQGPVLNGKLRDLELARLRVAPEFIELVEGYHQVLANFMRHREQAGLVLPVAKFNPPRLKPLTRETLKQLDQLDARRTALRPQPHQPSNVSPAEKPPLTLQNTAFPPPTLRNP
jgi:hypothetical protein